MIQLNKPFIVQPEISTTEVSIYQYAEDKVGKTISATLVVGHQPNGENIYKTLVLWQGEEYDAIGQWTDEDAENRVKELL